MPVRVDDLLQRVGSIDDGLEQTRFGDSYQEAQVFGACGIHSREHFAAGSRRPQLCANHLTQTGHDQQQSPTGQEGMFTARERAVADRIEVVAGDFFADPVPPGDLYALGRILHDWTEEKILRLLARVHDHLPSGGGVLIAEKLLEEDRAGPRWALMQHLNMLTCTEGKERTLSEYAGLLHRVGFGEVHGCPTDSPLDAVLALKK